MTNEGWRQGEVESRMSISGAVTPSVANAEDRMGKGQPKKHAPHEGSPGAASGRELA